MNNRRIWFMLPSALIPYLVLAAMATVFFSTRNPVCEWIVETVFAGNIWFLLGAFFLFVLLAALLSAVCFALSIRGEWDPCSLAKTALIIKCFQIPAYLVLFVLGVLLLVGVFTFAVSGLLLLLNFAAVVMSSLLSLAAVTLAARKRVFTKQEAVLFSLLQFVFVADVVCTVLVYLRLSGKLQGDKAVSQQG